MLFYNTYKQVSRDYKFNISYKMNIYCDEAGNSGQNLLDKEQPVYVLATVNYNKAEAESILKPIQSAATEIHFNKLKKYKKFHSQIQDCLNNELISYDRIKLLYYDKKFALCAHLVDQLAEPVFYDLKIPFYDGRFNITYANTLHYLCSHDRRKVKYSNILVLFQNLMRKHDEDSIDEFYSALHKLYTIVPKWQKNVLSYLIMSQPQIDQIIEVTRKYTIDLALPSFTLMSDIWYKQVNQKLDIFHDDSKQIEYWREYISYMTDEMGDEKKEVGYDNRKMIFPLQINSLNLVSSKELIQIQVADLIASSFAHFAKNKVINNTDEPLATLIADSRLGNMEVHPLGFSLEDLKNDFDFSKDESANDHLDYLAEKFHQNEDKFNKIYNK